MEQNQNQSQIRNKRFKLTLTEINEEDFNPIEYRTFETQAVTLEGQYFLDSQILKKMAGELIGYYLDRKKIDKFRPFDRRNY